MSSSVSLNRNLLIWAAATIVAGGFGIALAGPGLNNLRHHLTNSLVSWGTGKSEEAQVAWYELAHVTSPRNPSVGLLLAQAQLKQGSAGTAEKLLSHYPNYLPAVQERGEILVQQEDFGQAMAILKPVAEQSPIAAYWLTIAQSEAGQGSTALATLSGLGAAESQSAAVLQDLLQLAVGQSPNASVSSPEAVETVAQAQSGVLPLALQLYRLGLLNTSQRVLTAGHASSLLAWTLEGQIALSRPTPNIQAAEDDYYQAFLLDPTNKVVHAELQALATQLKDQTMLNKIDQIENQLPTR